MNYLAHFFLAGPNEEMIIGSLLGDFIRGNPAKYYNQGIARGIRLHRNLDSFTDQHAKTKASRLLISPDRRRFAGVILDVCYDHFLARHWSTYSDETLIDFIQRIYTLIQSKIDLLPARLKNIFPRMVKEDWLYHYRQLDGVAITLERISRRLNRENTLSEAIEDIQNNYEQLMNNFLVFFPEAQVYANHWIRS